MIYFLSSSLHCVKNTFSHGLIMKSLRSSISVNTSKRQNLCVPFLLFLTLLAVDLMVSTTSKNLASNLKHCFSV